MLQAGEVEECVTGFSAALIIWSAGLAQQTEILSDVLRIRGFGVCDKI